MSRSWRTLAELRDNSCPAVDVCGQARATIHILPNMSTTLSTPAVESDPPIHDLSRAVHSLVHTSGGCARTTYPHDLYTIHPTYPQSYPQEWGKVERSLCRPDECVQDTSRTHPIGSFAQSRHLSTLFGWLSTVEQWLSHPLARAANRPSQPLQPVRAGHWVSSTPLVDKSAERGQLAPRWADGRGHHMRPLMAGERQLGHDRLHFRGACVRMCATAPKCENAGYGWRAASAGSVPPAVVALSVNVVSQSVVATRPTHSAQAARAVALVVEARAARREDDGRLHAGQVEHGLLQRVDAL